MIKNEEKKSIVGFVVKLFNENNVEICQYFIRNKCKI
jgi:hypothetical protein